MERKKFIFKVEIPYNKISTEKVNLLYNKGYSMVCNGNKKVVELRFVFKEVKFCG
jgi:hypothetical protein